jgi:hypothetical protein
MLAKPGVPCWVSCAVVVATALLILSALLGSVPAAVAEEPDDGLPAGNHVVYLPLAMRDYFPSPGDALIVSWDEAVNGEQRTILLQWNPQDHAAFSARTPTADLYTISRRVSGATLWQRLADVQAATDYREMVNLLGSDLTTQLTWDLRAASADRPLTEEELYLRLFEDPLTARALALQFNEVARVLGLAYLDLTAPLDVALEYKVERTGGSLRAYTVADIPLKPASLSTPTNVRAAWPGPDTLGLRPSSRPDDAQERYHWTDAQQYRPWDGSVYLMWDLPAQPPGASPRDNQQALNLRGYRVYRAVPGTPPESSAWQLVNERSDNCRLIGPQSDDFCTVLVGITSLPATPQGGPEYFFREDLHTAYTDPGQIYTNWQYKVCPVGLFRSDGPCSSPLTVAVRELLPPVPVQGVTVATTQKPAEVNLTWVYSDSSELSPPLRFYVTRSPTFTAPLEQWTVVYPEGSTNPYIERAATTQLRLTISDRPPMNQVFWYRVQVRDHAGNWSAPSVPVKGVLYTRTIPNLAQPRYDPRVCANNPMPLTLTGLDPALAQIVVYRAFSADGPWQVIDRVPVSDGTASITDTYSPPTALDAYYRFEAVDWHGNVSAAVTYCAGLEPASPLPPPAVSTRVECLDNVCNLIVEIENPELYADQDEIEVEIQLPGEDGPIIIVLLLPVDGELVIPIPDGATYDVTPTYDGVPGITETGSNINNFLDTNRHLAQLGPFYNLQWLTDPVTGADYVRVSLAPIDEPSLPVAAFRRALPDGNWMQVTALEGVQPHWLEDRSDPSPSQAYEYVVLAFSPYTYEMLGFWGPGTLPARRPDQPLSLTGPISPTPELPAACEHQQIPAADLGMPETLFLYNGWRMDAVNYYLAVDADPECPEHIFEIDNEHAYGNGMLTNGSLSRRVSFYDIGVNPETGSHLSGRIVGSLNHTLTQAGRLMGEFGLIELRTASAVAEVTLTLPPTIKAHDTGTEGRSNRIFSRFDNVRLDLSFDPQRLPDAWYLVDENLPWKLHWDRGSEPLLGYDGVTFDHLWTVDRLGYKPPELSPGLSPPDNNLGYLRAGFAASKPTIHTDGLAGEFETGDSIHYSTGQPAAFIIKASGALVQVRASQISGGRLEGASASLIYFPWGTAAEYVVAARDCVYRPLDRYSHCSELSGAWDIWAGFDISVNGGQLALESGGELRGEVTIDPGTLPWTGFEIRLHENTPYTLYIAGASFADAPTSWAPMPAENAWRRHNLDLGDLDPGLNLNAVEKTSYYYCYDPPAFEDNSSMDLYVRRGGVSEFLGIYEGEGAEERTNAHNYRERLFVFEGLFVDNRLWVQDMQTQLYLPYPSDAAFDLSTTVADPLTNCPASGVIQNVEQTLHRYWDFSETPTQYGYYDVSPEYGTALGVQEKLFGLTGTAVINGLHDLSASPAADPVTLNAYTEWLPSGDTGDVRVVGPPEYQVSGMYFAVSKVELSRYYSTPLNPASLPSTLGINLQDNFAPLSGDQLDASGNLTPQSLKACSAGKAIGCGFVVVDGNAAVPYFGELRRLNTTMTRQLSLNIDTLLGQFPVASNDLLTDTIQLMINTSRIPVLWHFVNAAADQKLLDLPVKFMGSTEGIVIAALSRDSDFSPDPDVALFHGDIGAVITLAYNGETEQLEGKFGIYLGYPASQAALRALAMNRPSFEMQGGVLPFDRWQAVEADVRVWAFEKFLYSEGAGQDDDPVDLAQSIWEDWCGGRWQGDTCTNPLDFSHAYELTMPVVRGLDAEAYGLAGLTSGPALENAGTAIRTGAAEILFRVAGQEMVMDSLQGGASVQFHGYQDGELGLDVILAADWLTVEMTRDGEFSFFGDTYLQLVDGWGTLGYLYGLATYEAADKWRIEGHLELEDLQVGGLAGQNVSAAFGVGRVSGYPLGYVGIIADVYFSKWQLWPVAATILAGSVDRTSPILRGAGYEDALNYLGTENLTTGWYVYGHLEIPITGFGCWLKGTAGLLLRVWYSVDAGGTESYGGGALGWYDGRVGCYVKGRVDLIMPYTRATFGYRPPIPAPGVHICESSTCHHLGGEFAIAIGYGFCSPKTWTTWEERWWGDDWCYQVGAKMWLSFLMPPGGLDGLFYWYVTDCEDF